MGIPDAWAVANQQWCRSQLTDPRTALLPVPGGSSETFKRGHCPKFLYEQVSSDEHETNTSLALTKLLLHENKHPPFFAVFLLSLPFIKWLTILQSQRVLRPSVQFPHVCLGFRSRVMSLGYMLFPQSHKTLNPAQGHSVKCCRHSVSPKWKIYTCTLVDMHTHTRTYMGLVDMGQAWWRFLWHPRSASLFLLASEKTRNLKWNKPRFLNDNQRDGFFLLMPLSAA